MFWDQVLWLGTGREGIQYLPFQTSIFRVVKPWMLDFHQTHQLWVVGGICFCRMCGFLASFRHRSKLQKPCRGFCKTGFQGRLNKLLQGRLPSGFPRWPTWERRVTRVVPRRLNHLQPSPPVFPLPNGALCRGHLVLQT